MDLQETAVKFEHISMEFPKVLANDDISLEIKKGEIFALVGENGAGKSTLMKILYGINEPTMGEVYIQGTRLTQFSSKASIELGVGMVHQHFMLVPSFTVAQNIVMSREPRRMGLFFDEREAVRITKKLSEDYGLYVDPTAKICDISVGLQQRVEILKALYRGADILILDEPTAVLTPQETEELFNVIRHVVREMGKTVIIITHKLYEVMAISDRVGVMRKGKLVGLEKTSDVNEKILASMMVGRPILYDELERSGQKGEALIKVNDLHVLNNRGLKAVDGLSLSVHAGEILGIAAIEGNGQSELLEAICGMRGIESGEVTVMGKSIRGLSPGQIRDIGLGHIPEDRLATGVSRDSDVADNLIMGKHMDKEYSGHFFVRKKSAIERYATELYERFDIRGAGIGGKISMMSGGNVQKVVVAREFSFDTPVLIISQPSRGVDIGAIELIHSHIMEKRNQGCAILLCSAELDEVFRLSDRIITLYEGKVSGEFENGKVTKEEIGFFMTGGKQRETKNEN